MSTNTTDDEPLTITVTFDHVKRAADYLEMCPVGHALEDAFEGSNYYEGARIDEQYIHLFYGCGHMARYATPPFVQPIVTSSFVRLRDGEFHAPLTFTLSNPEWLPQD